MKTKLYLLLLLAVVVSSRVSAQHISGETVVCPGQTITYYFQNGTTFDSNCSEVYVFADFNGQNFSYLEILSPSNPTSFRVTWPNEAGIGKIEVVGMQCCLFKPGCPEPTNASLEVQVGRPPSITASSTSVCTGGQVTLTATVPCGNPSSYDWEAPTGWTFLQSGNNVLTAGPAQVILQAPASGNDGTFSISARANIGAGKTAAHYISIMLGGTSQWNTYMTLSNGQSTICENTIYSVSVNGGTEGTTYSDWAVSGPVTNWYVAGGNVVVVYVGNVAYYDELIVSALATNACSSNGVFGIFYPSPDCSITTRVAGRENADTTMLEDATTIVTADVAVYPNPLTYNAPVTATWPESVNVKTVALVNPLGETVQTIYPQTNQVIFDIRKLSAGSMYTIKIYTEKEVITKKVLIPK